MRPRLAEDLAVRLRALEDREAIRNLVASYGPLADSGDSQGVAALWTEDGVYVVGGMGEARGRQAIAALIDGPIHRGLMAQGCAHLLGPVAIQLDGDTATAWGHSLVFRGVGEAFEVYRVSANLWRLVRGEDGWRVRRRENRLLDGSDAACALLSPPPDPHPR